MKKIIACALSIVMVFTLVSFPMFAQDPFQESWADYDTVPGYICSGYAGFSFSINMAIGEAVMTKDDSLYANIVGGAEVVIAKSYSDGSIERDSSVAPENGTSSAYFGTHLNSLVDTTKTIASVITDLNFYQSGRLVTSGRITFYPGING